MLKNIANIHFWEKARTNENYTFLLDRLKKRYEEFCTGDLAAVKYSDYKIYYNKGTRYEYEDKYFYRRIRLETLAIYCLLYPESDCHLEKLQDTIWAICDEYCWALPAHQSNDKNNDNTMIDLFAAETGFSLAEIKHLLAHRLDPLILSRIKVEIERRIINSYLSREFFWEGFYNNWNAVCAGSVGCTFMYEKPEKFMEIKPRIDRSMDKFLQSFKDDGACLEGLSYWNYGFSFFAWYAHALLDFTKGEFDYFKLDKVKEVAQFCQKAFLSQKAVVSFADGHREDSYQLGLVFLIKSKYPDLIKIPDLKNSYSGDHNGKLMSHLRCFEFYDENLETEPIHNSNYFLEQSGWLIKKNQYYGIAIKAGNNDEPHNHNDVGSFIIAANGEQLLCDLGAGEYTRQYFADNTRYSILCNSSLGHSVPILNGCEQSAGKEFYGEISYNDSENCVSLELAKAYKQEFLNSLTRQISFSDECITLKDSYNFKSSFLDYKERFVTTITPKLFINYIKINELKIEFDSSKFGVLVTENAHRLHKGGAQTVYLIDFYPKGEQTEFFAKLII